MRTFLVVVVATFGIHSAPAAPPGGNVLLVIADDLGVDQLACYGLGQDLPVTPTLDQLAGAGVRFDRCWSNPLCSPTRAGILTGRHAFRHGIGEAIQKQSPALELAERTLPECLDLNPTLGYRHALIGKWHLGNEQNGGDFGPNLAGFSHFAGSKFGMWHQTSAVTQQYFLWVEVTDGVAITQTNYNTTETVDDALAWIHSVPSPWFCIVSFCAPHQPFHAPPPALHTSSIPLTPPWLTPRPYYKAMVEALDTEFGRLLAGLGAQASQTTVVFVGDNGTPAEGVVAPFHPGRAKGTLFEGGVHVPLIVRGPQVVAPGRSSAALVQTCDLFATILDLAGFTLPYGVLVPPTAVHDAVSFHRNLADPAAPSARHHLFTEVFDHAQTSLSRAVRNERFKLHRRVVHGKIVQERLYDLRLDPFEQVDLLAAPLAPEVRAARRELTAKLEEILAS